MSAWMWATLGMLPPLATGAFFASRGGMAARLVAVQLAMSSASLMLMLMSFAFDQPGFVDLGLTLALLGLPGTLVMAVFLERWL